MGVILSSSEVLNIYIVKNYLSYKTSYPNSQYYHMERGTQYAMVLQKILLDQPSKCPRKSSYELPVVLRSQDDKNYFSFTIDDFIFESKYKRRLKTFGLKFLRAVTALGAARRKEVAVGSGLGSKAGNWLQVLLFLGGLKLHY
ncbi:hypothetical protein E2C01_065629 [Portunus trituberculatus]|uniref:Uncharacterized protein n=1 Tax=Portunus trituberculatus TaxID=210409 RepID=A0A5B7HJC4_PORTR|nr:hypothetical protein [Portunus trituberculatus]